MARKLVVVEGEESKERMIPEPKLFRRLRQARAVWSAFKFLARGGRFRVYLDLSGVDARIVKPVSLNLLRDGAVVDVGTRLKNARIAATEGMDVVAGLELAKDDEPGFRVKWTDKAKKTAWEAAGFEAWTSPTALNIRPKA